VLKTQLWGIDVCQREEKSTGDALLACRVDCFGSVTCTTIPPSPSNLRFSTSDCVASVARENREEKIFADE